MRYINLVLTDAIFEKLRNLKEKEEKKLEKKITWESFIISAAGGDKW